MALFDRDWADEIDEKWRSALKTVSLVTEVEFTDEELEQAIKFFALQLAKNEPGLIAKHHPGIFLVAMTQLGSRSWEAKTFYSKITDALEQVDGYFFDARRKVEDATKQFSSLLPKFELARLESDSASYRWVSPVLLHGAVPLDHLDELLDLIKRHIRKDPSMTGESLVEFLRSNPSHLEREPMALRLFLLHGREFTADYVSRVIDYASGLPSSLPAHITQRLDEYIQDDSERSLTEFPRSERPSFALTPDGSLILRLPPAVPTDGSRTVEWTVRYNKNNTYIRTEVPYVSGATRTEEDRFILPAPGLGASVLRGEFQTDVSLINPKDPLLVFDAMGTLLSRTEAIPPGYVTLFWPSANGGTPLIDGAEAEGTSIQPPFGWSGWSASQVRVEQGSTIQFEDGPVRTVQPRGTKAQLVLSEVITDMFTSDGLPVLSQVPHISFPQTIPLQEWAVTVTDSMGEILSVSEPTAFEFEIPMIETELAEKLTISARGPLGKGFTKTVPVVTGLSARFNPPRRHLEYSGGVSKCEFQVARHGETILHNVLSESEFSANFVVGGLHLKASPAGEAYRLVEENQDLPWSSKPESITAKRMRRTFLQVRGLDAPNATLSYTDGEGLPSSLTKRVSRGTVAFNLRDFADDASRLDRGQLILHVGERRTNIANVRPEKLIEFGELNVLSVNFSRYTESALTLTLFRSLQPWVPAEVVRVAPGVETVELPLSCLGSGPLRLFAELEDDWGTGPNLKYRRAESNSQNYFPAWDMERVPSEDIEICTVLSGQVHSVEEPTRHTIMRAIQVIHEVAAFNELPSTTRQALLTLVHSDYAVSFDEVSKLECSEPEKAQLLIRTGLHTVNSEPLSTEELRRIGRRSPMVALVASKSVPSTPDGSELRAYFADQFGQEIEGYWDRAQTNHSDGRWDPYMRTMSRDAIKNLLATLGAVPGLPLQPDSRIIASSALFLGLTGPEAYSKRWIRSVEGAVPALQKASLWKLVQQQVSHEYLCLPAASIAFSLVARLAAHGDKSASAIYSSLRSDYEHLALIAPELIYIDLIRADAAVTGALAR